MSHRGGTISTRLQSRAGSSHVAQPPYAVDHTTKVQPHSARAPSYAAAAEARPPSHHAPTAVTALSAARKQTAHHHYDGGPRLHEPHDASGAGSGSPVRQRVHMASQLAGVDGGTTALRLVAASRHPFPPAPFVQSRASQIPPRVA